MSDWQFLADYIQTLTARERDVNYAVARALGWETHGREDYYPHWSAPNDWPEALHYTIPGRGYRGTCPEFVWDFAVAELVLPVGAHVASMSERREPRCEGLGLWTCAVRLDGLNSTTEPGTFCEGALTAPAALCVAALRARHYIESRNLRYDAGNRVYRRK